MLITVNGETNEIKKPCSIADLLASLNIGEGRLAVELNGEIVPRSLFSDTNLKTHDSVEIVQAIGGG